MRLNDLLTVLDGDTKINIMLRRVGMFDGRRDEFDKAEIDPRIKEIRIKSVWYSEYYSRVMIEL